MTINVHKNTLLQAIAIYERELEKHVVHAGDEKMILGGYGNISKIRRDLIELRLMLREVEAEEDRKANKLGIKVKLNVR